jgi:hypothetical protein
LNLRPPGYEPGELPDCSTPRRDGKDSISSMPWWTWVALGIFVASLVAAGVIALLALRSLNRLQSVGERLTVALEDLAAKSEELERSAERASMRVESAEPHFDHLRVTLDRFSVLTWALGDVAKTVGQLRSAVLVRK